MLGIVKMEGGGGRVGAGPSPITSRYIGNGDPRRYLAIASVFGALLWQVGSVGRWVLSPDITGKVWGGAVVAGGGLLGAPPIPPDALTNDGFASPPRLVGRIGRAIFPGWLPSELHFGMLLECITKRVWGLANL